MKKIKMIFAACFIMGVLFYCPRFSVKAMAYETAWFPAPQMNLSQIAYETGSGSSHGDYNAIDILPGGRVFAPSVSYTHLDVYKRQYLCLVCDNILLPQRR